MSQSDTPQRWPAETIWQAVEPHWPGFTLEIHPQLDSTNAELMRRAKEARYEPILLLAEHQTAGKGRHGRTWLGEPGDALTFSIGLPYQPLNWSGLSLAVGLSLAESLGSDVTLKWPNDLWCQNRKLGGVLIEAASQGGQSYVVIGVGLNIHLPHATDLRTPAAAIDEFCFDASGPSVLGRVIPPLMSALLSFESQGFPPLQDRFNARDALKGLELMTSEGQQGIGQGVDSHGNLQLHGKQGKVLLNSSEVSIRPIAPAP